MTADQVLLGIIAVEGAVIAFATVKGGSKPTTTRPAEGTITPTP